MARIKRTCDDHLLVGYRVRSGEPERYWRCPDTATFERFDELDRLCKRQGTDTPDPVSQFGEVAKPANARATKKADAAKAAQDRRAAREAAKKLGTYTALEWTGDPKGGNPGPFFTFHHREMGAERKNLYRSRLEQRGAHFKDLAMDKVTKAHARRLIDEMVVCPNCLERATRLGRADLVNDKHQKLLASQPAFDGECIDEDGDTTHWGSFQKSTVRSTLNLMGALWATAIEADDNDDPRAAAVKRNPFTRVPIPKYADQPDNDDAIQALSIPQLDSWSRAYPEQLEALPWVGTHGMLRRSETCGIDRGNIMWPTMPEHGGRATLRLTHVYALENGKAALRPWFKTEGSFWKVELTALATEKLREHMTKFRSTPNPKACAACRAGTGEHLQAGPNPHRGCDFADNAPVWIDPATGRRLHPDTCTDLAEAAARAAGLTPERIGFKVTSKEMRLTGATHALEGGMPVEEVTRMGRWSTSKTLLKHYHRTRNEHMGKLLEQFDEAARAQLGMEVRDDAHMTQRLVFAERNRERVETENELLRDALKAAGIDPDDIVAAAMPERVVRTKRASAFDDTAAVRDAIATSTTRAEILRKLGIAAAKTNYVRLEAYAEEHDLTLPSKWGRKTA